MTKDGLPVFLWLEAENLLYYETYIGRTCLYRFDATDKAGIKYCPEICDCVTELAEKRRKYMQRVGLDDRWPMLKAEQANSTCYINKSSVACPRWLTRRSIVMTRWLLNKRRRQASLSKRVM